MKPCLICGEPSEQTRCLEHQRPDERGTRAERGYGYAWEKLSRRVRRMMPFCGDCGSTEDLTVEHTEETWRRYEARLPILPKHTGGTLCRPCNSKRGRARPQGREPLETGSAPVGKAQSPLHTRTVLK